MRLDWYKMLLSVVYSPRLARSRGVLFLPLLILLLALLLMLLIVPRVAMALVA
jgi:hypothetical protein